MASTDSKDTTADTPPSLLRDRLLLVIAAILWSLSGFFVKNPLLVEIPIDIRGPLLACYRALFAGLLLCPLVRPRHIRWRPGLVPMVVAFFVMNILFVSSMTRTSSACAIFLQYTATGWVAFISVLLLHERLLRSTVVSVIGAIAGIAWIVISEDTPGHATGNLLALGSGFSLACTLVMLRVLRDEDSTWLTALNHLAAGLLLLPWVLTFDVSLTPGQWGLIALLGIVQMGLPYVIFTRCVRNVSVTEAVLISLLEPLFNPVWVLWMWGEVPHTSVLVGGTMILGGLAAKYLIDAWSNKRRAISGEQ